MKHPFCLAAALALSVGACMPTPAPQTLADDPSFAVRDPAYQRVTAGIQTFEVTGPKDWRELNRAAAPKSTGQE